jgi:hypothetical protein
MDGMGEILDEWIEILAAIATDGADRLEDAKSVCGSSPNPKAYSFPLLQILHDLEKIACLGIARRPQHSHQALG